MTLHHLNTGLKGNQMFDNPYSQAYPKKLAVQQAANASEESQHCLQNMGLSIFKGLPQPPQMLMSREMLHLILVTELD